MFFIQYSYPNDSQGKIFGLLVLSFITAAGSVPVIDGVKNDFEIGWKVYQKLLIGLFVTTLILTISVVLLAFDKE